MKRDPSHDTDPMTAVDAITAPPGDAAAATIPDDLDPKTARILRGLDRPPRPPAPTPELRASSNGGDFVAYSSAAHAPGAPPRSDDESRRRAFTDLSTLVRGATAATTPASRSIRTSATVTTVPTAAPRMRARRSLLVVTCGAIVFAVVGASVWGSSALRTIVAPPQAMVAAPVSAGPAATQKMPGERLAPEAIEPASPSPPALATPTPARATTAALTSPTSAPPARAARHVTPPRASMAPRAPSPSASAASTPDDLIQHPW